MTVSAMTDDPARLYAVSEFGCIDADRDAPPGYWYEGGDVRLPRTPLVEAIARGLMQQLPTGYEGKMYGVLLVATPVGDRRVLKAFSGLLDGCATVAGWVPPIPGRDRVAADEARTLAQLDHMKQRLIALQDIPERQQYQQLVEVCQQQQQQLALHHQQRKLQRQQQRGVLHQTLTGDALTIAQAELDQQSRQDGLERRRLKQQQAAQLQPLRAIVEQADAHMRLLKQQRRALSRQLQQQFHQAHYLTNFAGASDSLQGLSDGLPGGLPTGTGDCCAPKLLHYAATHELTPLALAEFWWGASVGDRQSGEFYGACTDRCQPILGFLLSGLLPPPPSLYEDEWLIAVDKPAGLLSVPGRTSDRQDSVLTRLRQRLPHLFPVHRLDQDTSGVLLLAKDDHTHRLLCQQFHQRQVDKRYEAILAGPIDREQGTIDLPLWADPTDRPYQKVDWQRGKPSQTHFRVISRAEPRLELVPITGRTHQLRVHVAMGLGVPILGDRLYGQGGDRLYLHARALRVQHPQLGRSLELTAPTPF